MATRLLNADTGVDSGTGLVTPWKTLVYAVANSTAGDTLYCQDSTATYDFRATTITDRTIEGQSRDGVVFDGASGNYYWAIGNTTVIIKNITFQNIIRTGSSIIYWNSATSTPVLTVDNCLFKDCTCYSAATQGGIIGNGTYQGGVATILIQNTIFQDVDFTGSNYPGYFSMRGVAAGSTFRFYNNIFYVETDPTNIPNGVFISYNDTTKITWTIKNSIFRNLTTAQNMIGNYTTAASFTFTNCNITGFAVNAGCVQVNSQTTSPLFVDELDKNFRLRQASPCTDTAVTL